MIPYGRHEITEDDIAAVEAVLRSDFLTQGPTVPRFECAVANYSGANYSVCVNSATSALHIACLALNLKPGDWVWTSANTFVASANCARYCGANVDFVDIDSRTYNISIDALEAKLEGAERVGLIPKIIIPVHFAGQPCDMLAIYKLSQRYGFKIIEDASHAIGASYASNYSAAHEGSIGSSEFVKVGSCRHSDITVFSFHPVKIITTGEGGMALTNSEDLANRMRLLRTHGITSNKALMAPRSEVEIWNYQQIDLGFNYRITDLQAALGLSQMSRLDEYVKRRHEIAQCYNQELSDVEVIKPWQSDNTYSSYHLYPIRVGKNQRNKNQRHIYDSLNAKGIAANLHYIPVHRHPYYESLGFKEGSYPEAEEFYRQAISLPIYPSLSYQQQAKIINTMRELL
jgi:UDP-4-amino-4,6-dideoxy-N-acetyl-beta-L-altrosamine transaminase